MHIHPKTKLQLAAAVAQACHSDAEIDAFLARFSKPKPVGDLECLCPEPTEMVHQPASIQAIVDYPPDSTIKLQSQVVPLVDRSSAFPGQIVPNASDFGSNKICELQRQEIIMLRHELAKNVIPPINSAVSSVPLKRPGSPHDSFNSQGKSRKLTKAQVKAQQKRNKIAGIVIQNKLVHFEEPVAECLSKTTSKNCSSHDEPKTSSEFDASSDTLNRIIRLNQILKLPNPQHPLPHVEFDLLTLQAIKEAALGLLKSLQLSLQQVSDKVFEKEELSVTTIPWMTNLIIDSVSSSLTPLFLPNNFPLEKSTKKILIQEIWEDTILPIIYRTIENLIKEIVSIIILCCEHLEKYMMTSGVERMKDEIVENLLILRKNLCKLAKDLFEQSSSWSKGEDFQFNLIKILVKILERLYFKPNQKISDWESSGFILDLLENLSMNISLFILKSETKLSQIQITIGEVMSNNQQFGQHHSSGSSIIDRKFNRVLMRFWSL